MDIQIGYWIFKKISPEIDETSTVGLKWCKNIAHQKFWPYDDVITFYNRLLYELYIKINPLCTPISSIKVFFYPLGKLPVTYLYHSNRQNRLAIFRTCPNWGLFRGLTKIRSWRYPLCTPISSIKNFFYRLGRLPVTYSCHPNRQNRLAIFRTWPNWGHFRGS